MFAAVARKVRYFRYRRDLERKLRGNRMAFKAGERAFKKAGGASPALVECLRQSLENDRRLLERQGDGGSGF